MMKYGFLAAWVFLAVLPVLGQEDTQGQAEQTILLCDQIEDGEVKWKSVLKDFWKDFEKILEKAKEEMAPSSQR